MKASRETMARSRAHMSALPRPAEAGDQACELVPRLDLTRQLTSTGYGNGIEPGLADFRHCAQAADAALDSTGS